MHPACPGAAAEGETHEVGEHQVPIKLLDEDQGELLGGSEHGDFAEPPAGVKEIEAAAVLVFDVPFPHAGQYRFEITDGRRPQSQRPDHGVADAAARASLPPRLRLPVPSTLLPAPADSRLRAPASAAPCGPCWR